MTAVPIQTTESFGLPLELQEAILLMAAAAVSAAKRSPVACRRASAPPSVPTTKESTRDDDDFDSGLASIALALPFKTSDLRYIINTTAHACSIDECCRRGDLPTLQWWHSSTEKGRSHPSLPLPPIHYSTQAMTLATSGNHVHILDWWHSNAHSWIMKIEKRLLDGSARHGHVQALQWWFENKFPSPYHPAWDYRARSVLQAAAEHGQWRVIEWWIDQGMTLEPLAEVLPSMTMALELDVQATERVMDRLRSTGHWIGEGGEANTEAGQGDLYRHLMSRSKSF